jgi:hypothetical protein
MDNLSLAKRLSIANEQVSRGESYIVRQEEVIAWHERLGGIPPLRGNTWRRSTKATACLSSAAT